MSAVPETADPGGRGLDAERLARAGDYLGRYIDQGKLAGWQLVVARGGAVVWHKWRGLADVEAGIPVRPDTIWQLRSGGASYTELQPQPPAWKPEPGVGFGLGLAVVTDPVAAGSAAPAGTGFWAGALNTEFFADPAQDLAAMLFTQLTPYGALPLQRDLAQLVYPSLTG